MKNERIHYLDIAKGILILLLVMSHFSVAANLANVNPSNPNFTFWYLPQPLFTSFFMQCFFIISGLCANFNIKTSAFFSKMGKQLVIPWLFFEAVRVVYFVSNGKNTSLFPGEEFTSLWFLNALMIARIICWSVIRFIKSTRMMCILTLFLCVIGITLHEFKIGSNILCYQHGLIASFFVAIGYSLKSYSKHINQIFGFSLIIYICIIGGRFFHLYQVPIQDANIDVKLTSIPLFLATSLSGSFAFLFVCKKIHTTPFLEFFGRNSLTIYGLHIWPYAFLLCKLTNYINPSTQFNAILLVSTTFVLEIVLMFFAIKLLNFKYLKLLIGKY